MQPLMQPRSLPSLIVGVMFLLGVITVGLIAFLA